MDNFLGTAGQFSDLEIKRLEREYALQMEARARDLIDRGFLDSDYEGSTGEFSDYEDTEELSMDDAKVYLNGEQTSADWVEPQSECHSGSDSEYSPLPVLQSTAHRECQESVGEQPNPALCHDHDVSNDVLYGGWYGANLFAEAEEAFDQFQWDNGCQNACDVEGADIQFSDRMLELLEHGDLESYDTVIDVDYTIYEMMDNTVLTTIDMTVYQNKNGMNGNPLSRLSVLASSSLVFECIANGKLYSM